MTTVGHPPLSRVWRWPAVVKPSYETGQAWAASVPTRSAVMRKAGSEAGVAKAGGGCAGAAGTSDTHGTKADGGISSSEQADAAGPDPGQATLSRAGGGGEVAAAGGAGGEAGEEWPPPSSSDPPLGGGDGITRCARSRVTWSLVK